MILVKKMSKPLYKKINEKSLKKSSKNLAKTRYLW